MTKWLFALMAILICSTAGAGPRVVGYFPDWSIYGRKYAVTDIPANKLTHVNYAFAIVKDGRCVPADADAAKVILPAFIAMKKQHPAIQTLISVGGSSGSQHFSDAALTDASRHLFAQSCADFVHQWSFDGVDIDWEFPTGGGEPGNTVRPEDKHNFTLLLAELRRTLDQQGKLDNKHYALTIASPASKYNYSRIEVEKIHPYLDWINLMTYDFTGMWAERTGLNSPLFTGKDDPNPTLSIAEAVKAFRAFGVPDDKIVVGVPFYGLGFLGVKADHDGLFQPFDKAKKLQQGELNYRDIVRNYLGKGATRHWDNEAKVPWLFDPATGMMISYDDPESMRAKAQFIHDQKLGGVMIWEITGDDDQSSLLNALVAPPH